MLTWTCCFLVAVLLGCCSDKAISKISTIEYTVALPHGAAMPRIGFGTAGLRDRTAGMVTEALRRGLYMVDSAQAAEWYDESGVQQALVSMRTETVDESIVPFVVTKVHPRSFAFSAMDTKLRDSENFFLGGDAGVDGRGGLDLVLIHSPFCWQGHCTKEQERHTWKEAWKNLETMKKEGRINNIGVSNFDFHLMTQLESIANSKVAVIQNWMDPFHQDAEVRHFAEKRGIVYMAYSSFGTQWEHKMNGNPVFSNVVLNLIADRHNKSVAQVVTSWLLQEGVVAIPRTSNIHHLEELTGMLVVDDTVTGFYPKINGINTFLNDVDMKLIRQLDGTLGDLWE